jgi:hypothetical protein
MENFSQRYGHSPLATAIQTDSLDKGARIALWNYLNLVLWGKYGEHPRIKDAINKLTFRLWVVHFNADFDHLPSFGSNNDGPNAYRSFKTTFFDCEWFKAYDFLEFVVQDLANGEDPLFGPPVIQGLNRILERHNCAFRIIDNRIVPLTAPIEIKSVEAAISDPSVKAREHLETALSHLSNRDSPDFRNSIKESISAVEAVCREISGNKNATLSDALKLIDGIHPALRKGFDSLYGYTSDGSGIRHALKDESTATQSEATFMVVVCSAFIGYLRGQGVQPKPGKPKR